MKTACIKFWNESLRSKIGTWSLD